MLVWIKRIAIEYRTCGGCIELLLRLLPLLLRYHMCWVSKNVGSLKGRMDLRLTITLLGRWRFIQNCNDSRLAVAHVYCLQDVREIKKKKRCFKAIHDCVGISAVVCVTGSWCSFSHSIRERDMCGCDNNYRLNKGCHCFSEIFARLVLSMAVHHQIKRNRRPSQRHLPSQTTRRL
ncbi:hypothetical protein BD408DRAFT_412087 [Parasitella parasitica]|nr:hypothetical protein BD408DRAFT_412087 [Parasitella parasitica]